MTARAGRDTAAALWNADILGPRFQQRELPLAPDDEGEVSATLVRCLAREPRHEATTTQQQAVNVVLYVHGWADYFLQAEAAAYLTDAGFPFYAVDLRKFGRRLRPWQTPASRMTLPFTTKSSRQPSGPSGKTSPKIWALEFHPPSMCSPIPWAGS